ncbi:hypothetical protein CI258_002755 [Enterococcus faecium]|nr:hypothetical protein CI258_002755 [Enterococcus faecium]
MTKVLLQPFFPDKRCSISCPSVLAQQTAKYEELFFPLTVLITCCRAAFSQPLSLNGVLLPIPRSQVTIFNKHDKRLFHNLFFRK